MTLLWVPNTFFATLLVIRNMLPQRYRREVEVEKEKEIVDGEWKGKGSKPGGQHTEHFIYYAS